MTIIRVGQLVKIKEFAKFDAMSYSPDRKKMIGLTGRFISTPRLHPLTRNAYHGDFEFDPDPLDENKFRPVFSAVIVEPLED